MRPKDALSGAGGAGSAEGRSTAASETTRMARMMACYRTAADSHAEKSCSGAEAASSAVPRPKAAALGSDDVGSDETVDFCGSKFCLPRIIQHRTEAEQVG